MKSEDVCDVTHIYIAIGYATFIFNSSVCQREEMKFIDKADVQLLSYSFYSYNSRDKIMYVYYQRIKLELNNTQDIKKKEKNTHDCLHLTALQNLDIFSSYSKYKSEVLMGKHATTLLFIKSLTYTILITARLH